MTSATKKVEDAAKSIDEFDRLLMHEFGKKIQGGRHFNETQMSTDQKNSVRRLLDLGIVSFESVGKGDGFEYAYHWTKFGDEVMRHLGILDTPTGDNDKETQEDGGPFYKSVLFWTILGVVIAALTFLWAVYKDTSPVTPNSGIRAIPTSTVNISDIISKAENFDTLLEQKNFLENYRDSEIYGLGSFINIDQSGKTYYVYVTIKKNIIACAFNEDTQSEKKLLLLKKGDEVSFSGIFTGGNLNGAAWYVENCTLYE